MRTEIECLRGELDRVEMRLMPFGHYQGRRIADVVRMHPQYLVWLVGNFPLHPLLRREIVRALRAYKPPRWRPGDPAPGRAEDEPVGSAADAGRLACGSPDRPATATP